MNTSQEQLLRLLREAIHGEDSICESFSAINVKELFNCALQHSVYPFLYSTLKKYHEVIGLDELVIRRWKEVTLYTVAQQASMIKEIKTVLQLLDINGIPTIPIKGLVLKKLYPLPELRSMGDMDLLIGEENIQRTIELLISHGYYTGTYDLGDPRYMHIVMRKTGSFPIELHRTLWHPTIMKAMNNQQWENHLWENKRLVKMGDFEFAALSIEDEFINIIVHLARHTMHGGAKLRQLCDFALFVKEYWENLDTEYIDRTIKSMDLYKFYQYLIFTCNVYLGFEIPVKIGTSQKDKPEKLIYLIFTSSATVIPSDHYRKINIILDLGEHLWEKIKIILKRISFIPKTYKLIEQYRKRPRSLRSIGLYYRN
ncbi:hypothetical protein Desor_5109 [Desulfosporosinus orientis DSM 765]|uniref:Nucleotidyltransferase family protein n=1 Tax=Desulfosporosinus orientis (strain ATCC 19365 / DSM 765 / NCIMB 8382 / VKM B-1628 / Singapore I) TaxID=768706 RepID=G7WJR3_DESOD|nr:nucleotidyltransferase family protein [Desulfosporosinus orientis]AET70500.1 hypothetical protein Desor_5109 [Desulfosporosinus orientis DSM 765]